MYVLAINGSHRKGNTEAMLKKILDGAASKGARVELVNLREKNVEACKACMGCENTGTCRIQDDFPLIFEKLARADALVLGSPNYFNNVSALTKGFIDRMNAHWQDKRLEGKKAVLVMPGGYSRESVEKGMDAFSEFPRICKMKVIEKILPVLDKPTEAQQDEKLMQECLEIGKKLAFL
jgi:multimeric flavodoxin WrbA